MTIQIKPIVVDISHHNNVVDLKKTYDFGIRGIIHKSSEGTIMIDHTYHTRRELAKSLGFNWGAYHFNGHGAIKDQVAYFIAAATPEKDTLMALDWEDAPDPHNNMDHLQAKEFIERLDDALGRKCKFYSGNRAKEELAKASDNDIEFFVEHDLWLCQYPTSGIHFTLPKGFKKYWLWQYTGDGTGPLPHNVPGIIAGNKGLDINHFDGTEAELKASWVYNNDKVLIS